MASKRIKEHTKINDEVISNEDFLDVFNHLVKIENDMKKWVKETKSNKKKDREEKEALKVEIKQLKVKNINLKKQLNDLKISNEDPWFNILHRGY